LDEDSPSSEVDEVGSIDGSVPPRDLGEDAAAPADAGDVVDGFEADAFTVDAGRCGPLESCGDACVDLSVDDSHCGTCGRACGSGRRCEAGVCVCAEGLVECGAACVDLRRSADHCGGCERACPSTLSCRAGECGCELGERCGDRCVDTETDRSSCGGCGVLCSVDRACVDGRCSCESGAECEVGECMDLQTDDSHCGACGQACGVGRTCVAARCECARGIECGGECVDAESDRRHCGGCGLRCPAGASCAEGECRCPVGAVLCADDCVDPAIDPANCGGCGVRCPAGIECRRGTCACPTPTELCGGRCVDTSTDPTNCGACGNGCRTRCTAGACLTVATFDTSESHTCAALDSGEVYCWGVGFTGQLGQPNIFEQLAPRRVDGISDVVDLTLTSLASCAARRDGTVWCWGSGSAVGNGDVDASSVPPTRVAGLDRVIQVTSSLSFVCALRDAGDVWCWGPAWRGAFGAGYAEFGAVASPVRVPDVDDIVQISAGRGYNCALRNDGRVSCWGNNESGKLGLGFESGRELPTLVPGLANIVQLGAGYGHTCALRQDGVVLCWGGKDWGSVADGTVSGLQLTPTPILGAPGPFVEVAVGSFSGFAVTSSGECWAWGSNTWGYLSDGTSTNRPLPVRATPTNVAEVRSEGVQTCFLSHDGVLSCSGWNLNGAVGDRTTEPRFSAVDVRW